VFIGNPSDSGEGNFDPSAFALFVVQMNEIDTVVNVFFDETILPQENSVRWAVPPRVCACQGVRVSLDVWCAATPVRRPDRVESGQAPAPPCSPPLLSAPPAPQPIVGQCQVHCGGVSTNDDDQHCKCDGSSTPSDCLWDRCTPYPSNSSAPGGAPFCCCASIDIKMQWVGAECARFPRA
jgi:hypothetical protein